MVRNDVSSTVKARMITVQGHNIPDHLLQEFIDGLLAQFRCVAELHETVVLVHIKRVTEGQGKPIESYSMSDIWNKIQAVVQVVADYYSNLNDSKEKEKEAE